MKKEISVEHSALSYYLSSVFVSANHSRVIWNEIVECHVTNGARWRHRMSVVTKGSPNHGIRLLVIAHFVSADCHSKVACVSWSSVIIRPLWADFLICCASQLLGNGSWPSLIFSEMSPTNLVVESFILTDYKAWIWKDRHFQIFMQRRCSSVQCRDSPFFQGTPTIETGSVRVTRCICKSTCCILTVSERKHISL